MSAEDLKVGKIITTKQERDAIHIAIAPVTAFEDLQPGEAVALGSNGWAVSAPLKGSIGVVDPFLQVRVRRGQQFWLFLKPGSITSLRHDWTHPQMDERKLAKEQFAQIANSLEMSYDMLVEVASNYLRTGEGHSLGFESYDLDMKDFWEAFQNATGITVPNEEREAHFFSCSC